MPADDPAYPPYSYVPGGPWPHPMSDPRGHSFRIDRDRPPPIDPDRPAESPEFLRGVALFHAGYYWEAHEAWEGLWHAHHRRGPIADLLKGLIKLAAAGVKVRQGQAHGVATHATRAAQCFDEAKAGAGRRLLGLDLEALAGEAARLADAPLTPSGDRDCAVVRVLEIDLRPF